MQVAPSGYWRRAAQQRNPALRCALAQRNDVLSCEIERVWQANMQVYGADKVWRQLRREGTDVARCTVERLMHKAGLRGRNSRQGRAHHDCRCRCTVSA
jgi:putative transposase